MTITKVINKLKENGKAPSRQAIHNWLLNNLLEGASQDYYYLHRRQIMLTQQGIKKLFAHYQNK